MANSILLTIAIAVLLGAIGQALASLARLPAIVFLLFLGSLMGPQGLGIVHSDGLGSGLQVLTACFVGIILFEGGLSLPPSVLRESLAPVRRLITIGALVTLIGAAVVSKFFMDWSWSLACVFGSLVIVTGPTVVVPILKRVRLTRRLHSIVKSEGILIDAVGAVAAVVILEYVVALDVSLQDTLFGFGARLGTGAIVGAGVAGLTAALWRFPVFHEHDNLSLVHLGGLGVALSAFAVSEALRSESGIMAATTAGLVLAAFPIPFRRELLEFKEVLTTLGVSVLFVLLSAKMDWASVLDSGWREIATVLGLMFLVRPAAVWIATIHTDLTWREKAYLSLLAPRGIVAAAMASHFSIELQSHGFEGATQVESLVFLTIGLTVCLQGGWANQLAKYLKVDAKQTKGYLVVGVNSWSLVLATELQRRGILVRFLDQNPVQCDRAIEQGFQALQGDASDVKTFDELDLSEIGTLVAMTSNDAVNTLACDAANDWLGRNCVFQILSKPIDGAARANVRMSGKWAMPTTRAHQTICTLLRRENASVSETICENATTISRDLNLAVDFLVPLLVVDGDSVRLAVSDLAIPAGAKIIGLTTKKQLAKI